MWFFFLGPGAIGAFFLSSWLTMIFWGIIAPRVGIVSIDYPLAMLVTIALWLTLTPFVIVAGRKRKRHWGGWE